MRTINYVRLSDCEEFIRKYVDEGGSYYNPVEGSLGLGVVILHNGGIPNLRNFVIEEYYLNEWSSGHRIKCYYSEELPKKYWKMIEDAENCCAARQNLRQKEDITNEYQYLMSYLQKADEENAEI